MAADIIREYLVSLGYEVDTASLNQAKNSLNQMAQSVSSLMGSMKNVAAITAATAAIYELTKTLYQFTIGAANAELQNEMFARKMWMNYDAAVSYKSSLQALGVSLQDLYLSPELMNKFIALRNQAGQMGTPAGYQNAMKGIRDITFELARFKLEISYGAQWVAYYLTKYLGGPAGNFLKMLQNMNNWIVQNMPKWTAKVAEFISYIGRMWQAGVLVGKELIRIWNDLGASTQKAIGLFTGIGAAVLILSNPIYSLIAAFGALLLLVDDYYVYQSTKGKGETAFGGLWQWLDQQSKKGGAVDQLRQSFNDLKVSIGNVYDALKNLFATKDGFVSWISVIKVALEALAFTLTEVAGLVDVVVGGLEAKGSFSEKDPKKAEDMFNKGEYLGAQGWNLIKGGFSQIVKDMQGNAPGASGAPAGGKATVITLSPTYYITEAGDAGATAKAIQGTNYALLMRAQQGVVR